MYSLRIVRNAVISNQVLKDVIKIKSVAWPYSFEEQVLWMENNLTQNDLHVLLLERDKPIAYLNLLNIEVLINSQKFHALGIGNVCAAKPRMGYGSILMDKVSDFVHMNNYIGLLFCKAKLVPFYEKFNWNIVQIRDLEDMNVHTMMFNIPKYEVLDISYEGILF